MSTTVQEDGAKPAVAGELVTVLIHRREDAA